MIGHRVDGEAIRQARLLKGIRSGRALGALVGVTGQHMLRIERGYRQPSASVYQKLLTVLKAEEGDFLLPKGNQRPHRPRRRAS